MNKSDKRQKPTSKTAAKRNLLPVAAVAVVLICAIGVFIAKGTVAESESGAVGAEAITAENALVIPVSSVTEQAAFYPVEVDGTEMEVFAIRASDGTIRTAFNTCQSCYTSGKGFYSMQDEVLVCNNCGFHFSPDQVEVSSGGCNPWPIFEENKTVTEDSISISYEFLSQSRDIFASWKTAVR